MRISTVSPGRSARARRGCLPVLGDRCRAAVRPWRDRATPLRPALDDSLRDLSTTCFRRNGCWRSFLDASIRSCVPRSAGGRRAAREGAREGSGRRTCVEERRARDRDRLPRPGRRGLRLGREARLVVTNAHVVAGIDRPRVDTAGAVGAFTSTVVAFDVTNDIAVLRVRGLGAARSRPQVRSAASRSRSPATRGTDAYAGRRPASADGRGAQPARRVRERSGETSGHGGHRGAPSRPGSSGGPGIDAQGRVRGRPSSPAGHARRVATGFRSSSCARSSRRLGARP